MAIKTQINALLSQKMDRQDFLKTVAVGLVAISGLGTALRVMNPSRKSRAAGYGTSAYGGSKKA